MYEFFFLNMVFGFEMGVKVRVVVVLEVIISMVVFVNNISLNFLNFGVIDDFIFFRINELSVLINVFGEIVIVDLLYNNFGNLVSIGYLDYIIINGLRKL